MESLKNKKIILILLILALLLFGFLLHDGYRHLDDSKAVSERPRVIINGTAIDVLVADTPQSRQQGLSGRPRLEKGDGMLFIFNDYQPRSFWMKNMNFPIDIIWIDSDKIVKISENLQPEGETPANHYSSDAPVNYVLEVNANFSKNNNLKVGDKIEYVR